MEFPFFILFTIIIYLLGQVSGLFWQNKSIGVKPTEAELIGNFALELFTTHGGTIILLGFLLVAAMLGSVYLVKKEVENL